MGEYEGAADYPDSQYGKSEEMVEKGQTYPMNRKSKNVIENKLKTAGMIAINAQKRLLKPRISRILEPIYDGILLSASLHLRQIEKVEKRLE